MPSLTTLLIPLLLALYTTPTAADSCIGTKEVTLCCPGSLFGGLVSNNGKPTAHGICCIDPSTLKRRSIDTNIINIINEDILPLNRREDNVNVGVTTCSENQILVPLSATDYEQQVASIVASITGGSSSVEPTNAATNKAQDSSATTTTSSTGGMPAATGQGSYLAAIGGAVAAAVLVAGAL
ncbi:hypothetical protein GX50_00590 [[Emmonsia] crescens]|uniref:Hydrophobin n=1 Tax=[Emmonsia] crescens TaxID=73230 RepID=A0A2B7ZTN9_9EURO|nr:hypothetical protein GX50_00590 [Emmonsia crescens]